MEKTQNEIIQFIIRDSKDVQRIPNNITELINKYNDLDISNMTLPNTLIEINLGKYHNPIENIKFPPKLKKLKIGIDYGTKMNNIIFPDEIEELYLYVTCLYYGLKYHCLYDLENIIFPNSLKCLTLMNIIDSNDNIRKIHVPHNCKIKIINTIDRPYYR